MMRFMRFHRRSSFAQAGGRAAVLLLAGLAGGCTAQVSGFDLPSFSSNDDRRPQQTASTSSGYGRSNLGNDSYGSGGAPYNAPRTYRENGVSTQALPDAAPSSSTNSGNAYSGGRTGTTYANNGASSNNGTSYGRGDSAGSGQSKGTPSNSYTDNGRYGTVTPPPATHSTNRYDPQPTPSLANPGDSIVVQPGDTLYGLSRRYNVSVAELMQLNSLSSPNLALGQKLYLPQGVAANRAASPPPLQTASVEPAAAPAPPADLSSKYRGSYTMRQGDSLYGISRSHGVSVAELQQANGITDARGVKAGTVLRVPGGSDAPAQPMQQVAAAPSGSQPYQPSPATSYPNDGAIPSGPTIINDAQASKPGASYTQVTTRNANDVAMGTVMPSAPRQSTSDKLRWPVSGRIIAPFGQRNDGTHNDGINMSVPAGTSVHAAEGGTVAYAGSELRGYGNLILLRHDNGWVTAYAHNDQLMVKRGDKVQRGQPIATAGRTGSVDQPQVHFELRVGSKPVDPVPYLEGRT